MHNPKLRLSLRKYLFPGTGDRGGMRPSLQVASYLRKAKMARIISAGTVTALLPRQISKAKMVSTVLLSMIRFHSDFQKPEPALRCFHWQTPVSRENLSKAKIVSLRIGTDPGPALLGALRGLVYGLVRGLVRGLMNTSGRSSSWLRGHGKQSMCQQRNFERK